jgi:hypothetical protein
VTELEQRLAGLARAYPFPPTPDLAEAAGRRLPRARRRHRLLARRLAVALAVAAAALAGTLALSPGARAALADLLDLVPGVRLERTAELPSMAVSDWFAYGERVSVEQAERAPSFEVRLPASLGRPELAYRYPDASGSDVVTFVYGSRREARLVLTQWAVGDLLIHKLLGPGTDVEIVRVGGERAAWISGSDHDVFYVGLSGDEERAPGALAGNVLVWQDGGVAYRLEAGATLERALELAADLR